MTTKVIVNLILNGQVKKQQEIVESIPYCITKQELVKNKKLVLKDGDEIVEKGNKVHNPLTQQECKQVLKISDISYKEIITNCPEDIKPSKWTTMTKEQRLEHHIAKLANDFHANSFSFEIL